ncbi:MAG: HD domain-containing protein [Desulfobacteraceae bacterium]|jgi:putative hydrolase of HD superfamily
MKHIAEFMFEACFLKHIPRSGYQYLGTGGESVADHVYSATMIAFVFAQLMPEADSERLMGMCLFHDLPETRIGDLNYVQKHYVKANEKKALADALENLPFRESIADLLEEFNAGETLEARLAHDADQLALIIDLMHLKEIGHDTPEKWLSHVKKRLKTDIGIQLGNAVLSQEWDGWWRKIFP